nr:TetR family transcriptional regulator [Clostridium sp. AF34-10BH]
MAGELDMTKGALYRHYKGKRDIFDCIVERME